MPFTCWAITTATLVDRPREKMGSWERDVYAQLDASDLDWLRAVPPTRVFRDSVFLCHATPASDEAYWLETALPDGNVAMSPLEAIEKAAVGVTQPLILCAHTHIARAGKNFATGGWWSIPAALGCRDIAPTIRCHML